MQKNNKDQLYLSELIKHCSNFRLDGLPAMGEMFYQEIALEDIFAPLRLLSSKDSNAILELKASIWDTVNDHNRIIINGDIDDATISQIDDLFPANDIPVDLNDFNFTQLISFIDAQIKKPISNSRSEISSFIEQLDSQIQLLSYTESAKSIESSDSIGETDQLIDMFEKRTLQNGEKNPNENGYLSMESFELIKKYDDGPVGPIFDEFPSRRIILSNPGYGKTTLAKRIALAYATNDNKFKENYHLPGELFPVLLYCRSLDEDNLNTSINFSSIAYLMTGKQFVNFSSDESSFTDSLISHALDGSLLLIIDGFDELLQKKQREIFATTLYRFLLTYTKIHLILTSRITTFSGPDRSESDIINTISNIPYIKKNIIPALSISEVDAFIRRWHNVLFPFDAEKTIIAERIIEQLHSPAFKYLEKIVCVPLHLSNILLIARNRNSIPNNKIELCDEYVQLSLNWHATGNIETSDIQTQLAYIAYHMTKKGQQRISVKMLQNVLLQCSVDLDGEFLIPIDESNVQIFIRELEERTCILEKSTSINGIDIYEFTHLFLQEYLTAYAISRGCSEDSDEMSTLDAVSMYYTKTSWREVIILSIVLTNSKSERNSIIDYLIHEAEENDDNYHATNLLFELIANGVPIRTDRKHAIYDLIFKEHITDYQIRKICEFMKDLRSGEFKKYVVEKFNESLDSGDSNYAFALATINAFEILNENKNPLIEAEKLVLTSNDSTLVVGLYIFTVLGWCKYCKIKSEFAMSDIILSPEFSQKIRQLILSHSKYLGDLSTALKDIILANYIDDLSFLDASIYSEIITLLKADDDATIYSAEKILSSFPLNYRTLSFHQYCEVKTLRNNYLRRYRDHFSDNSKTAEIVFDFSICALLGCWDVSSDELLNQFTDLEGVFSINKTFSDDASRMKLQLLQHDIYNLSDPVSAGMDYYSDGDFDSAKSAFMIAFEHGNTTVCNNLAYMLRRGEISDVTVNGNILSVDQLLENGIGSKEPFSLINYALYIVSKKQPFDYKKGLNIIKPIESSSHSSIQNLYSWWLNLALNGENEGLIVIAWLTELHLIPDPTPVGSLADIKSKLGIA